MLRRVLIVGNILASVLGCAPDVIESGSGSLGASEGGGSANGGSTATGGTPEASSRALVLTHDQLTHNSFCKINGSLNPPDARYLVVSQKPIECDHPSAPEFNTDLCVVTPLIWKLCIPLSNGELVPGTVSLSDDHLNVEEEDTGGCSNTCCGGGGTWNEGSLEIIAITDSTVDFTLSGTHSDVDGAVNPNGTYAAIRCP